MSSILFLVLLFCLGVESFFFQHRELHFNRRKLKNINYTLVDHDYYNFTQKVDHFDVNSEETFEQRYWVKDDLIFNTLDSKTPVFIFIGGEAEASGSELEDGFWIEMAKKYGAICFVLEHRYYGHSRPTSDTSVENLRYLSVPQALGDVAYFIEAMNEKYELGDENKWVAFGGSYAGSLAAWLRLKYPHLVAASVSSSAPLLAKADFFEYYAVVRKVLAAYSKNNDCLDAVINAFKQIENMTISNPSKIDTAFRLCTDIDEASPLEKMWFMQSLLDRVFAEAVQYNQNVKVKRVCRTMTNENLGAEYKRLAKLSRLLKKECLAINYESIIEPWANPAWDTTRLWVYQCCTEFGYFQTLIGKNGMLLTEEVPLESFVQDCQDTFGEEFNSTLLNNGIKDTNTLFGGKKIKASNVIYVNGDQDPWSALGITEPSDEHPDVILIKGASHCADMYTPSENDTDAMKEAHALIEEALDKMLEDNY